MQVGRSISIVFGSALLIAVVVAIVIASRSLRQPVPLPDVPVAASPAEVRVKAVERNVETLDFSNAEAPLAMLAHSPLTSVRKYGTIPVLSPKRMTV
jgi:hypothetical protein